MADTDTIKAIAADGKTTLTVTRAVLVKNVEYWVWCHDKGFSQNSQTYSAMTDDLRLALAGLKAGTGNVQ